MLPRPFGRCTRPGRLTDGACAFQCGTVCAPRLKATSNTTDVRFKSPCPASGNASSYQRFKEPCRIVRTQAQAGAPNKQFEAIVINHDDDVVTVLKPLPPDSSVDRTDNGRPPSTSPAPTIVAVSSTASSSATPAAPAEAASLVPTNNSPQPAQLQSLREDKGKLVQLAEYQRLYETERGKNESLMVQLVDQQRVLQNKEEQLNQSHLFLMEAAKERAVLRQQLLTRESQLLQLEGDYHKAAQALIQAQGLLASLEQEKTELLTAAAESLDAEAASTMDYVPADSVLDILKELTTMTAKLMAEANEDPNKTNSMEEGKTASAEEQSKGQPLKTPVK